jgi:hypothetical protein
MTTIYIVPIEPIDQRYTKQWYDNIPRLLADKGHKIVTIDGEQPKTGTTTGAFLDFAVTNIYKSSQTEAISKLFANGTICAGDKFLVTDAWNSVITAIRYMSDLLDIPVEIHGIWHAGAYDPTDILGMKMSKPWPWHQERAWFHACDYNYYATDFHRRMYLHNLDIPDAHHSKAIRSGQPHEYIVPQVEQYHQAERNGRIMWPHRLNSDKQPDIIRDIAAELPVTITQGMDLPKDEYYRMLGSASVVFSCSLHENLGISQMEGVLAGALPIVPDRASYTEMYPDVFKYPAEWTSSWHNYNQYREYLLGFIRERIDNYDRYLPALAECKNKLISDYLNANIMINKLTGKHSD